MALATKKQLNKPKTSGRWGLLALFPTWNSSAGQIWLRKCASFRRRRLWVGGAQCCRATTCAKMMAIILGGHGGKVDFDHDGDGNGDYGQYGDGDDGHDDGGQ